MYVLNRSPSGSVDSVITSYEGSHEKKPNVSDLKAFDCECNVHVTKQLRKKLD